MSKLNLNFGAARSAPAVRFGRAFLLCGSAVVATMIAVPGAKAQALPAQGAAAQASPAQDTVQAPPKENPQALDTVVVTAQKRSENVQNVPIAIQAFSVQAIEKAGLTNVTQLSNFTPNVTLTNTSPFAGSAQVLSATIRGIGQDDFAFNLEPGVGLYVDGIYYARSLGATADLLDLDHLEILKGPQGTLFGRNTIGGAISIVTRDPANTFGWAGQLTSGAYNRTDVSATVDLPLIDNKVLAQFSLGSKISDGWQKRIPFPGASAYTTDLGRFAQAATPGGPNAYGGENVQNGRAKLLLRPTDNFKLVLATDFTHVDEEATPYTLLATNAGPTSGTIMGLYNACILQPAAALVQEGLGAACGPRATVGTALAGANLGPNPRLPFGNQFITGNKDKTYAVGNDFDRENIWGVSATADWKIADGINLKSITAYRQLTGVFGGDIAAAPMLASDASFEMSQHQFSQEEQLSLDSFNSRLKSLLGLYYFNEGGHELDYPTFGEGLVQIYGPSYLSNQSYAGFVHEHFDVTPRLGVTVGVRYSVDKKTLDDQQHELNEFNLKLGVPAALFPQQSDLTLLYPPGVDHRTFVNWSTKAGLEYKLTDTVMSYFSFSQGFKDGGWTIRLSAPAPGNIAPTFGPELADTYELGLKSEFFDRRVRANLAVFDTEYSGLQTTVQSGLSPVFQNAGNARIRGFEGDAQARLIQNLTLTANVGYLDAAYTKLAPGTLVTLGDKLINTPKYSASLGLNYDIDLPNRGVLSLQGDYSYKSTAATDAQNTPSLFSGDINLVNASVTYAEPHGAWKITAGAHNLTNDRFVVTGFNQLSAGQIGYISGVYSPPTMWYVTLRIRGG